MGKNISGFSKLSKSDKINWLISNYLNNSEEAETIIKQYWNSNTKLQKLHDEFIENTISNYYLPLGIAPNFLINDKIYAIPMVTEESSVVAAASKAAKYWFKRGGFKAEVISSIKVGQVHFNFNGPKGELETFFQNTKNKLFEDCKPITESMEKRGGGILEICLLDKSDLLQNYYQLEGKFDTRDAMGANFINSCLEQFASTLKSAALHNQTFQKNGYSLDIIMSILSNYTPECVVNASVSCPVDQLFETVNEGEEFVDKFIKAVDIARLDPFRAVTHNKGIMNGIDAVVIATGNDFRAVEAAAHAYASRNGTYSSLTKAWVENNIFNFSIEIPLSLGTVGGLTGIHPLVGIGLKMLGDPSAEELMNIIAAVGLAQNFGALKSLTTTGIQQGHMKMHLLNILNRYDASENEKSELVAHFKNHTVTHSSVIEELEKLRS